MTLTLTFEAMRQVNTCLAWFPFALLAYRAVTSWDADYVRPDVIWHYRTLVVLLTLCTFAIGMSALQYEESRAAAGPVSAVNFVLCIALFLSASWWPQIPAPSKWEDDHAAS